jgi:hypothetical protein
MATAANDIPVAASDAPLDMDLGMETWVGDELDLLWNHRPFVMNGFLPAAFFDTNFSLSHLAQQQQELDISDMLNDTSLPVSRPPETVEDENDKGPTALMTRLPSLEPGIRNPNEDSNGDGNCVYQDFDAQADKLVCPWAMSAAIYKKISESPELAALPSKSFTLPSRYTLVRYLDGYFRGFHIHLPFLHAGTCNTESMALELLLALAAVGALYRFEHTKGYELYVAARALIDERIRRQNEHAAAQLTFTSPDYAGFTNTSTRLGTNAATERTASFPGDDSERARLQTVQALLVLLTMSSWGDKPLVGDSLAMGSQLAFRVRKIGINNPDELDDESITWSDWVAHEERRRTLFMAYILSNLQTIAFDVPPLILNQEVALYLPSSEAEWRPTTAASWERKRVVSRHRERSFSLTLNQLLTGHEIHDAAPVSAFSNYILIHGLVQQIFLERHAASCVPQHHAPLHYDTIKSMEAALRAWQRSWEATWESTLDPSSPKGPLGFNATALLRLAYIRLNTNLSPNRNLQTRDPECIARAFTNTQVSLFTRSPHVDRAVLQCIHALSIPIRVGIAFVARTQTLHWSIQHALCSLECAFLLKHWLQNIASRIDHRGLASIYEDERKLLGMLTGLVRETELKYTLDYIEDDAMKVRRLAASTVRLWAETFRGISVFQIVHVVGATLSIVADTLEAELAV